MKRHRVGSVPVVDQDGRPVGIVAHADVIDLALSLLRCSRARAGDDQES